MGVVAQKKLRRVLSLGAGVQSTTLLLMAEHGETEPLDVAVFADTGWEPAAVYRHLDWLREEVQRIPIVVISKGNIRDDTTAGTRFASLPFYVLNQNGEPGKARRQCTKEYKIAPIRKQVRQRFPGEPIEMWIGISLDEAHRMKDSGVRYITNRWPLIERGMTRHDCLNWLQAHGYPEPPKSSCIGCPFHGNAYWRDMKRNRPAEFADAVGFDAAIRDKAHHTFNGELYVHRSLIPLADVDLRNEQDRGQMDMFGEECDGVCFT